MAFSELELKRIDKRVGEFCRNRVPAQARTRLRYIYRVEGQAVTLAEERPRWDNPDEWLAVDFAKLKYIKSRRIWKLFWMRASGKWETYKPHAEDRNLEVLVEAIATDRHGCFFG